MTVITASQASTLSNTASLAGLDAIYNDITTEATSGNYMLVYGRALTPLESARLTSQGYTITVLTDSSTRIEWPTI